MSIGEKIKTLRKKRNYSQEALADQVQTTRQTIYNWENDITVPNINDIKKLSQALECDHDYFFNESDEISPDINTTGQVISQVYKGVKKHWRKIYIYFFISGSMFAGMGLLIRFISNQVSTQQSNFPGQGLNPGSIFRAFSNFTLIVGFALLLAGLVIFIKDYKQQKKYQ